MKSRLGRFRLKGLFCGFAAGRRCGGLLKQDGQDMQDEEPVGAFLVLKGFFTVYRLSRV